jgi:Leucine-rich repeat (LRR) protein
MKSLDALSLKGSPVTDVSALRRLKALTSLDLSYTEVRDLRPLHRLKALEDLDIQDTPALADGKAVDALRAVLPDTRISP